MKKSRIIKSLALILTSVFIAGNLFLLPAQAGKSETILDGSTLQEELDITRWNNPSEDVVAEKGVISFPANSTSETRLITKAAAIFHEAFDVMAQAEATFDFSKLPSGQKFIFALGLANVESMPGDAGNIEIAFAKKGNVTATITAYTEDGEAVEVMSTKSCGAGKGVQVKASVTTAGYLKVLIDGKEFCNAKLPVSGQGRVGFLQTGYCEVKVSNVNIRFYRYDSPENCDIDEDFESGTYNKHLLTSQEVHASWADAPTRACIEEYQGNQVYMLSNVGAFYFGTMHKYSNFEISFDVPYLQRAREKDEQGNLKVEQCAPFGIAFGGDGADYQDWGFTTSAEMVLFSRDSSISSYKAGGPTVIDPDYLFFDKNCDRGFSVKVSVIDAVVTVYLKWIDEAKFKQVSSYRLGSETPLGYIQIWTTGCCSFAFDNFKLVNKDINPNLIEVEYESAKIEIPADYNYEPEEKVYAPIESKGLAWYIPVGIVAVACAVTLIATIVVKNAKSKSRKEGVLNEE